MVASWASPPSESGAAKGRGQPFADLHARRRERHGAGTRGGCSPRIREDLRLRPSVMRLESDTIGRRITMSFEPPTDASMNEGRRSCKILATQPAHEMPASRRVRDCHAILAALDP